MTSELKKIDKYLDDKAAILGKKIETNVKQTIQQRLLADNKAPAPPVNNINDRTAAVLRNRQEQEDKRLMGQGDYIEKMYNKGRPHKDTAVYNIQASVTTELEIDDDGKVILKNKKQRN